MKPEQSGRAFPVRIRQLTSQATGRLLHVLFDCSVSSFGFRRRKRLAKAGLLAATAAAATLTMNACSPTQAVWYPLAIPGMVTQGFSASHPGVDIYVPYGTRIHAATAGVVTQAGWWYGYGNYTCIQRDAGFKSCYAHQSVIYAHVGLRVTPGPDHRARRCDRRRDRPAPALRDLPLRPGGEPADLPAAALGRLVMLGR